MTKKTFLTFGGSFSFRHFSRCRIAQDTTTKTTTTKTTYKTEVYKMPDGTCRLLNIRLQRSYC
jgi:hypothetical protein